MVECKQFNNMALKVNESIHIAKSGQQHDIKFNNFLLHVSNQTLKLYACLINRGVNSNSNTVITAI